MRIQVTAAALNNLMEEWDVSAEEKLRIYVRYSGGGEDAFALGMTRDVPREPAASVTVDRIQFYIEQGDTWFLDGKDILIDTRDGEIVLEMA